MAVMTSLPQDSTTFEQKTEAGPSPDKMAVDIPINGTSTHDESIRQTEVTMSSESDPLATIVSTSEAVNGAHNTNAFSANDTVSNSLESRDAPTLAAEQSHELSESVALPETYKSNDTPLPSTSNLPTSQSEIFDETSQSAPPHPALIETFSDLPVTITLEPTLEVQQSELREEVIPVSQERAAEIQAEKHELDLIADPELAAGLSSGLDHIERATDSAPMEQSEIITTSHQDHPVQPASFSNLDINSAPSSDPPSLEATQDTDMLDAPPSPSKVAHDRDEEMDDGPSAKRPKVEDDGNSVPQFAMPSNVHKPSSSTQSSNGEPLGAGAGAGDEGDEFPPTPYQVKEMLKAIKHIKGTINGKNFVFPVSVAWPTLAESYLAKITNPIDLTTIEERVKNGYSRMAEYKADVRLIYENAAIYNGVDHGVTKAGATVRDNLLGKIPGPEPAKVEKKPRKSTPVAEPAPRATPARRQSRGVATTARSPTTTTPTQTFALGPSGTPLIRRDSMVGDGGRPKREIHPPKSRDLPYSARPRKKKFAVELKFCEQVLSEISKAKYAQFNNPFMNPVDPVALGIPTYHNIIKTPMDVSTVSNRLHTGQYETSKDFFGDMKQIFKNCYKFNPTGTSVYVLGKQFEELFDAEWAKKAQYLADHSTSNAGSPSSTIDSDEEESEEEEAEEPVVNASSSAIQARLVEEQTKLIELMGAKKRDPVLIKMQQEMVEIVKKQADFEAARLSAPKKAKAKPVKKAAPAKKEPKPKKGAPYKAKVVGHAEKEQISAGIGQLDPRAMEQALALLKLDLPHMDLSQEMELDIDDVSPPTLSKLYDLIVKNVPGIVPAAPEPRARAQKPQKPKKNKPMSKTEQESKIAKLKQLEQQFDRPGSTSDDARATSGIVPSVEQDQSSGDESSSDSEED